MVMKMITLGWRMILISSLVRPFLRLNDRMGLMGFWAGPQSQLNLRAALLGQRPPEILVHGIVTPADVDQLFKMCVTFSSFLLGDVGSR